MKLEVIAVAALCTLVSVAAQAHEVVYNVTLGGASEAPPNNSPATGTATVTFDLDLATMRLQTSFSGLTGTTTAAHIHCCTALPGEGTAGVATQLPSFIGFPLGVDAGSFDGSFDLSNAASYNPAFVTANGSVSGAMNALLAGAAGGAAYLNLHTTTFPGGEIRGFLAPVPEVSSVALMALGLLTVAAVARRRVH